MTQTLARIKKAGKHFEIVVDLDKALSYKKGQTSDVDFLEIDNVFSDSKKGFQAASSDLKEAFGTDSINDVAGKIVLQGEVLLTQEHRSGEREQKVKQAVDFLATNAIDSQAGRPLTPERIKSAIEQAGVNIKNSPIESQINEIVEALRTVIPIKISTKKVKITIPALHTGKVYGLINQYKENENWLENGDLQVLVNVPAGMIIDFYDKLNSVTHGSALTEEVKNTESEESE